MMKKYFKKQRIETKLKILCEMNQKLYEWYRTKGVEKIARERETLRDDEKMRLEINQR